MSTADENAVIGTDMGNDNSTPAEEKGPAVPPKEMQEWRAAALPAPTTANEAAPAASISPAPGPPRLKKKVPWKGKNIMVLLPLDDERGNKGKAPTPLSDKDVESMLAEWENLGYNTSGFNLGHEVVDDEAGEGQSRSIWPQALDMNKERERRQFRVSIPDRQEWDSYCRELAEAKLRALGVTLGDEEPAATISPAASTMSRQPSITTYPPLPFSPPIPTGSAASSHMSQHPNPFSPALMPGMSTSQSSNPGSIASPASMHGQMHGKYNPRQSVSFTGGEHPFGSPFQYPQQPSPGVWSPQQMLYQQGGARGGSPSLQNLSAMVSPSPPFSPDGYFPQGDAIAQVQQRQQFLQNQFQQQQIQIGARASPRLQEVSEMDEDGLAASKSPSKTPEARHIRQNPSASLQKEIDDAEYHLEEQFQRQLEHDDYSPHSDKGDDENRFQTKPTSLGGLDASHFATGDSEEGPVLHHPQPHSRGHSLSQRPFQDHEDTSSAAESKSGFLKSTDASKDTSDIETNPSNLGTPVPELLANAHDHSRNISISRNPLADSESTQTDSSAPRRPGHATKASMSTLNVDAKEFKFDPTSAFKPSQFAFGGGNFQAPVAAYSAFVPPMSATSSHFSHNSISSGRSKINVAAPPFTPGQSEFSFSASGPTFRPDAPTFTPSNFTESVGSINSGSEGPNLRSSIFGNIDLSALGISKPSKKNKAIPIIRPDSSHSRTVEDETMEGKDGRITQGEGRIKRARGGKDDGDSVPLFASNMPLGETSREQSPPKENLPVSTSQADKENSAPISEGHGEAPEIPPKSHSRNISQQSPEQNGKEFDPYEFSQQSQAEDFNAARPFTSRRYASGLPGYGFYTASSDEKVSPVEAAPPEPAKKQHKKNSLSATAKPFEFRPGAFNFTFGEPPEPTPAPAPAPVEPTPIRKPSGLAASRFASSPTPPADLESPEAPLQAEERPAFQFSLPGPESPPRNVAPVLSDAGQASPTFEEIDAMMQHLNKVEMEASPTPRKEPKLDDDIPRWHQPSPTRRIQVPDADNSSPIRLLPQNVMRSDAPSPSPGRFRALPGESRIFSRVHEDPFVGDSPAVLNVDSTIQRLNIGGSLPGSDWDDVLSEAEEAKLHPRAQFFDSHVDNLVGGLLDQRLDPLEKALETIQMSIEMLAARAPSSRRERRSISGALSDADDEDDDETAPRRSMSPRRDKKMEKIRAIITEALAAHQSRPQSSSAAAAAAALPDSRNVLQKLEEMKEQFGQSMRLDLRGEDLRNIVEEAVTARMPATPSTQEPTLQKEELESVFRESLQKHLPSTQEADEIAEQKEAEFHAKIAEMEERVERAEERHQRAEAATDQEIKNRRAVEDRLAEIQRLLRISSEEEMRLRESMDEREVKIREIVDESDAKVRAVEESRAKTSMRIALLEANQDNSQKSQTDLTNRLTAAEAHLFESRKEVQRWQIDAERALEAAKRHSDDAEQANETNKELRRTIETLRIQTEESVRVREGMRGMLTGMQEDMARAARDITEENARRAKKESELIARQEVLDAKLQAEARTRERLETEILRLEAGEREGMRAVSECKRLEALVVELKQENHLAEKDAMRYQREFEEARESGLSEVKRTRNSMQVEIDNANHQVNLVRDDLEAQITRLRNELDQFKLDSDAEREKHEMLLESAEHANASIETELKTKHANEIDDLQTKHERQLNNALEDAQRSEQHLLERLSLSSSKTEHLQDRVSHLEEKLEISKSAAMAAVAAAKDAKSQSISSPVISAPVVQNTIPKSMELPERISPQALRESIMVLQEQLQDREQSIEKLESTISKLDPDSATKIQKRDDEIMWLRELLAVRKSDLTDVVNTLESEEYDPEQVKDAAIRLRANLQMEEQERERAMNGGSALNLPNIAASLRDAASPRVAQAVGPLAAAWGNWRKNRADSNISEVMGSGRASTPSRTGSPSGSFLGGLLTPPASSLRTPPGGSAQPTAFGSTGQRFTREQLANRPRNMTPRAKEKQPMRGSPRKPMGSSSTQASGTPKTPPMMRKSSYDLDARAADDFGDAAFYDDDLDESTIDDSIYGR